MRVVVRQGLGKKRVSAGASAQNQCVFLTAQGRCRIHELHGEAAKPLLCRMFPFQLVSLEGYSLVTLRRHCPSAAADLGRTLEDQFADIRQLAQQREEEGATAGKGGALPPPLLPGRQGSWHDFLRVAETLERFLLDQRFPLVRRLAHGLKLCDLVEQCRLQNFSGTRLDELLVMLENSAVEESDALFGQRRAPGRAGALLFRQTALEYLRLHPSFVIQRSWRERWRLIVLAAAFARGRGRLPAIHPCFPPNTFEALEAPLGNLPAAVLRPLEAYFEAAAASKQYALLSRRHWSLVENFRAWPFPMPLPCGLCGWVAVRGRRRRKTCAGRWGRSTAARPMPR